MGYVFHWNQPPGAQRWIWVWLGSKWRITRTYIIPEQQTARRVEGMRNLS
jgi:hypothetical protein